MLEISAKSKDDLIKIHTTWDDADAEYVISIAALIGIKLASEAAGNDIEARRKNYKALEKVFRDMQDKDLEEEFMTALIGGGNGEKHTAEK